MKATVTMKATIAIKATIAMKVMVIIKVTIIIIFFFFFFLLANQIVHTRNITIFSLTVAKVTVTINYRLAPHAKRIKIQSFSVRYYVST